MMDRTPHPEQPAEGADDVAYTEETIADDPVDDREALSKLPGGDTRELNDPPEADSGVDPDAHIGIP